ncbi:MAG TPA: leucyl aminopeptidase [Mycobacteriales bacterium]|nr:leucyl aminopeptidase [Mycobacteriales bacterium]
MTTLTLASADPAVVDTDAIVVGVTTSADGSPPRLAPGAGSLDAAFGGRLAAALAALGASGGEGEVTRLSSLGATRAPVVAAVGLGAAPAEGDGDGGPARFAAETVRRAAGAAVRALAGTSRVALALPGEDVRAAAEGALLGAYAFDRYRSASADQRKPPVTAVSLIVANAENPAARDAVRRAEVVTRAVALARDLVNTPPNDLHPQELADAAVAACAGLEVEVLDEDALRRGGFGGILGVGQGSAHPPRLVRIAYRHPEATRHVALVGKGITFDSGGLSLKPAEGMDWMKSDMGGAAAVIAAMQAVRDLAPRGNVTGWVPTAENMPSGTAQRPSDVLTTYGGKTVEVLNTDAEGRLILADAIVRAAEEHPDVLVDAATLTGAQLVALGTRTFGVMANDDELRAAVVDAAGRAGEAAWPMPLPDELRKGLDSEVADIANVASDKWGGMLRAGVFLREFVPDGVRWAHLDIAGPAFNHGEPYGYTPKGGTGAAVRTFVQVVEDLAGG